MIQSLPEANDIYQTFQAGFDGALCNALEKYHSRSGFTLLLGSVLQYTKFKHPPFDFPPGLVASLYLLQQEGDGDILDDIGFSGIYSGFQGPHDTREFFAYFVELLENPERSGSHAFNQHRYATAAKECLQLCSCSHHKFSKGPTDSESALHDKILRRNKPWAWKARLGVYSRIRKAIRHLTVRRWKSLKPRSWTDAIDQYASFTPSSFKHEYSRF